MKGVWKSLYNFIGSEKGGQKKNRARGVLRQMYSVEFAGDSPGFAMVAFGSRCILLIYSILEPWRKGPGGGWRG